MGTAPQEPEAPFVLPFEKKRPRSTETEPSLPGSPEKIFRANLVSRGRLSGVCPPSRQFPNGEPRILVFQFSSAAEAATQYRLHCPNRDHRNPLPVKPGSDVGYRSIIRIDLDVYRHAGDIITYTLLLIQNSKHS